ncbi:MAG: hypothetical protein CSB34_03385 [Desulfobulbus propionicus]|nr:MAG: hypothetical protein CSB34_03385 [Desulfobulbus propionicus]
MAPDNHNFGLTADELKGKQSTRATFRLPPEIIKLLSVAATQLGIKQKTLFDQLVEDREVLGQVALEAKKYTPRQPVRRQKTFVLSRNSLVSIEKVAEQYALPRDVLVEISINRLLPIIDAEQKKQEQRRAALVELEKHHQRGLKLFEKTKKLLGEGDPVCRRMERVFIEEEKQLMEIREIVARGSCVEDF